MNHPHQERSQKCLRTTSIKAKPQSPRLKRPRLSSGKSDPRPVGSTPRQDKIRIVLEGFRREVTVSDLCRREGIKPGVFYAWTKGSKGSKEAGKERLTRDTVRDATRQEIEHLKRKNQDLKQLVDDLSLGVHRFKRTIIPAFDGAERPGEVERHKPGGRDPVGRTEVTHPTAGAQE